MWFVIDGVIVTPKHNCLKGITAKNVMKSLDNQSELKYCYRDIHASEILNATEAFITSRFEMFEKLSPNRFHFSTRNVWPVKEIQHEDGTVQHFPLHGGEITRKLQYIFADYIKNIVEDMKNNNSNK